MTNHSDVLTQALEALEHHTAIKHPQQRHYRDAAIEALRAALAETAEPVALTAMQQAGKAAAHYHAWSKQYTAPQPPAPAVELTDREICDLWSWSMTAEAEQADDTQQHAFARAAIAAHEAKKQKGQP